MSERIPDVLAAGEKNFGLKNVPINNQPLQLLHFHGVFDLV